MSRPRLVRTLLHAAILLSALAAAAHAQYSEGYEPPDDPAESIRAVNRLIGEFPKEDRAEFILLPALAKLDGPPAVLRSIFDAIMTSENSPSWPAFDEWAGAAPQQNLIEKIKGVTPESPSRWVFALPVGDQAEQELRDTGLAIEVGSAGMLADAKLDYLERFKTTEMLVHVEATRLAFEGDVRPAIELLVHWVRLTRMVLDHPFGREALFAFRSARDALERMRDLAYTYPGYLGEQDYRDLIKLLDDELVRLDRVRFPVAEKEAALQLIALTMQSRRGPDRQTFGPTLAQLAARERPLMMFAEASRWEKIAEKHGGWFDTLDTLEDIYEDWKWRWDLSPFDAALSDPTDYSTLDPAKYALLAEAIDDFGAIYELRREVDTELKGTRLSFGVLGYKERFRKWPNKLAATRPRYVKQIDDDPYVDPDLDREFEYYVPMRDTHQDARRDAEPFPITVSMKGGGGSSDAMAKDIGEMNAMANAMRASLENNRDAPVPREVSDPLLQNIRNFEQAGFHANMTGEEIVEKINSFPNSMGDWEGTPEQAKVFVLALIEHSSYKKLVANMNANQSTTAGDIVDFIDFMSSAAATALGQHVAASGGSSGSSGSFIVYLDDTVFVLFSAGSDGAANWAKRVGPGGDDYIIWPPLMSFVRGQRGG